MGGEKAENIMVVAKRDVNERAVAENWKGNAEKEREHLEYGHP